jgi:TetR/AcrR family transcriptional repressor of bet genes
MMEETNPFGRKAPRALRREQLIEATISTLAERGLSQMTIGDVAKVAGVSHGLINFHFQSKDRLLEETLSHMSREHRNIWMAALAAADPAPASRLSALMLAEFDPMNLSRERLLAWCVFWGEALKGPLYLRQCGENDTAHIAVFEETCTALVAEGGYVIDPRLAARVLRLTIHGVKLELTACAVPYDLRDAMKTAFFCAATLFPRHFDENGLISR